MDSLSSATSATVSMPCACSFSAVFAPTPHSRRTGSGCRNASSRSGGTSSSPSGLASWLATLARNLVRAMPTVIGSPTRSRTLARSVAAISTGVPDTRHRPPTRRGRPRRRYSGSTTGVVSWNTSNTASLAWEYADIRGGTTIACGHNWRACDRPSRCARRRPWPRSSRRARRHRRRSRAAAQRGVVALLDGCVERIQVSVQNRGRARRPSRRSNRRHEHMFASGSD